MLKPIIRQQYNKQNLSAACPDELKNINKYSGVILQLSEFHLEI